MSELDEVKAELEQVKEELRLLKTELPMRVMRMVSVHTHCNNGKVKWNIPTAALKKAVESFKPKSKTVDPMHEHVDVQDEFVSKLVKVD